MSRASSDSLTTRPESPIRPKRASRPLAPGNLSLTSWSRKRSPSRSDALLSPARRSAKAYGTSPTDSNVVRASSSSRILKPFGLSAAASTAERRTRKNPLIGSLTPRRRRGKSTRAAAADARETSFRIAPSPPSEPPSRNLVATTRS